MFGPIGLFAHCFPASSISAISRRRRSHSEHGMSVALEMNYEAKDCARLGWRRDAHKNPAHVSRVVEIVIRRIDLVVRHDDLSVLIEVFAMRTIRVLDRRAIRQPYRPRMIWVASDTFDRIGVSLTAARLQEGNIGHHLALKPLDSRVRRIEAVIHRGRGRREQPEHTRKHKSSEEKNTRHTEAGSLPLLTLVRWLGVRWAVFVVTHLTSPARRSRIDLLRGRHGCSHHPRE